MAVSNGGGYCWRFEYHDFDNFYRVQVAIYGLYLRGRWGIIELLYGYDESVAKWVSEKIGNPDFGLCRAIGVLKDDNLIAGVVYSNYIESPDGRPIMCEISMAAIDKRWANKYTLNKLFAYPFIQLKVERVQVSTPVESRGVRKINEKLGFIYEGTARKAHFLGGDVDVLSMLKHECRWL